MSAPAQVPPRRPSGRRRPTEPPPDGHRPLRSVGYRVPVVLDDDLDADLDDAFGEREPASDQPGEPRPPMWERDAPVPVVPPPPVSATDLAPLSVPVATGPALEPVDDPDGDEELEPPRSLYLSALRVHHVRPGIFARVLLVEGVFAAAIILVLADLASAWLIAVLPVVVAVLVKLHDLVEEGVERSHATHISREGPPGPA